MIKVYHNPDFLNSQLTGEIPSLASCELVAEINHLSLHDAFLATQHTGVSWTEKNNVKHLRPGKEERSTSWGDLMTLQGKTFYIKSAGYKEI